MSLLIHRHIKTVLFSDKDIKAKIGDRLFPIVAPEGISLYPYVVMKRIGSNPDMSKDGDFETTDVRLTIVGKQYTETVELADLIKKILIENCAADYKDFMVLDSEFVPSSDGEDWDDVQNCYVELLDFNFETT